jgi:hypothetical protein
MADELTPNYGLTKPDPETGLMSNFETYLNANWDILADAASPPSGTTLPQAGDYNVGDRFYKSDTKSIYILVCKDANWGWHWRPVQDAISPWMTVPATCLNLGTWTLNPVATNPFAIALDSRGRAYWRGVIGTTAGNISRNVSHSVFKALPIGIRPARGGAYMLGHETISVGTSGANLNAWQGARIYISDGVSPDFMPSVRTFGGTADFNRIHLTGIHYSCGSTQFTTP